MSAWSLTPSQSAKMSTTSSPGREVSTGLDLRLALSLRCTRSSSGDVSSSPSLKYGLYASRTVSLAVKSSKPTLPCSQTVCNNGITTSRGQQYIGGNYYPRN